MAKPAQWEDKHLQLHGFVVPGSIKKRLDKEHQQIEYKFRRQLRQGDRGPLRRHRARHVQGRAEVVVKGTLDDGRFHAHRDQAKCPSKYQARPTGRRRRCAREGDANVETAQAAQ